MVVQPITIGVLALQGAFREHCQHLTRLGVQAREVRLPADLNGLAGLILPGGESTTIGKLAVQYGLLEPIRDFAAQGKALWGTCAGAILLAKDVGRDQPLLKLLDVTIRRNAFGRQIDSFETELPIVGCPGGPFPAIFIRAPLITDVGADIQVLAQLPAGEIVAVRAKNIFATAFHPELSDDSRFHQLFLEACLAPTHDSGKPSTAL